MSSRTRAYVAKHLRVLLDDREGSSPQERGDRRAALGEGLSAVLQELMVGRASWDSRYSWLDGVLIDSIERRGDTLHLVGFAVVVHGPRWALRPVVADLAPPPAMSTLFFAAAENEVPYSPKTAHRLDRLAVPPDPETWPYVFEVELA
jgi:hypothetical protein